MTTDPGSRGALFPLIVRDFLRCWDQLALTDLFLRIAGFVIFTPLVALLLRFFLARSGQPAVTDEDILFFFLRPMGLAALLIVGGVTAAILFAEAACVLVIAFGAASGDRISWRSAMRYAAARFVPIFRLTLALIVRVLLIAAPFAAVAAAVAAFLLRRYDINYYLEARPPSFLIAIGIIGVLIAILAAILIWKITGWLLALPILLFERRGAAASIRASVERARGRRGLLVTSIVVWAIGSFGLSALASAAAGVVGHAVIDRAGDSLEAVAFAVGATLLVGTVLSTIVTFVTSALLMHLVVRIFMTVTDRPAVAGAAVLEKLPRDAQRPRLSRRLVFWAGCGALIAMLVSALLVVRSLEGDDDVEITAHRGASWAAPENTIAAVEQAIAFESDWVEIDVQLTADDVVAVVHDEDLMRVAGERLRIEATPFETLREIDIGSHFGPEFADERLPTLEEVLDICRGRAGVNIELKQYGSGEPRLADRVIEVVESKEMAPEVVLMSLKPELVHRAKTLRPEWTVGLLIAVTLGDATRLDADFLAVNTQQATSAFLRSARRRGRPVHVWTVNDPVQMSDLISRGVDNIITDVPDVARAVLARRATMTPAERLLLTIGGRLGLVEEVEHAPESDA